MSWTQLIWLSRPHSSLCSFPIFKISLQLWLEDISIWGEKKIQKNPPNLKILEWNLIRCHDFLPKYSELKNIFMFFILLNLLEIITFLVRWLKWCGVLSVRPAVWGILVWREETGACSVKDDVVTHVLQALDPLISADRARKMWPTSLSLQNIFPRLVN